MREAVPEEIRRAVCLRFLASGVSFRNLVYAFKISNATISITTPEVLI